MKIAPIMRAFANRAGNVDARLVHTGQHYDVAMNDQFFRQLRIPAPHLSLEVGSGSHAVQTAEIMRRFEPVLDAENPDVLLVVGDVNSTIACALVAAKKGVRVVHVEAGLRSRDRQMPEEINRVLTDQLSDRLYVTEADAVDNLVREGIDPTRIVFVGNVMIDTLLASLSEAVPPWESLAAAFKGQGGETVKAAFEAAGRYGILTLHRPANVDDPAVLSQLLTVLGEITESLPLVFPLHPRTRGKIQEFGLLGMIERPGFAILPPLGYLEMLGLMQSARLVLTDSGGVQEETTALGVPCLTLRENTERPVTVEQGTNTVVGMSPDAIRSAVAAELAGNGKAGRTPEKWDGAAACRIVDDLLAWLQASP
jgi:UDP-N-acetylglucosamine 2-epimerase (non-hydrolysing)